MARWIVALVVVAGVLVAPAGAVAGNFGDPGARVFTLVRTGPVFAVASLPDGRVVYSGPKAVVVLDPDGSSRRVAIGHDVGSLAVASDGSVFAIRERGTIVRIDLQTGTETSVATITDRDLDHQHLRLLTALADDSMVAVSGEQTIRFWKVAPSGQVHRILLDEPSSVESLAPLARSGFAFTDLDGDLRGVTSAGRVRLLASDIRGPITASGDGAIVTGLRMQLATEPPRRGTAIARVEANGTITPHPRSRERHTLSG